MIAKGSWLRVRGNIENNNFTHALTMNVQDVKEIIHHDRKDLMPEDQNVWNSMRIRTCQPWMLCQRLKS